MSSYSDRERLCEPRVAHPVMAGNRQKIVHDNWMVAKSLVFCGAATAPVAALGWATESFVL